MPPLSRTLRVIGVALAAGGRAVDFALIETDGGRLVRRIETERQPLGAGDVLAAVTAATRVFMGDRALQPFAVDLIALADDMGEVTAGAVAARVEVETWVANNAAVARRLAGEAGRPAGAAQTGSRAERAAFAVVAAYVGQVRLSPSGGGLAVS